MDKKQMVTTTDGIRMMPGLVVYYVSATELGEPVKSHVITSVPTFKSPNFFTLSVNDVKAVADEIYSTEEKAKNFKAYVLRLRSRKFMEKFYSKDRPLALPYNPSKEV